MSDDFNSFEMTKGTLRKMSPEEEAFINGTAPVATASNITDSSASELEAGARRVVPDGHGGFKPVASLHTEPAEVRVPAVERAVAPADDGSTIIRIPKASRRVTIKCTGVFGDEGRAGAFTVGIDALSVDVEDDGVSILMRSDIDVRPPTLVTMVIDLEGVSYNVIYTGGKHRLGNCINMSFARV